MRIISQLDLHCHVRHYFSSIFNQLGTILSVPIRNDTFVAAAIKQNSSFVNEIRHLVATSSLLLRLDLPRGTAGIVSSTGSIFYSNWSYSDMSITLFDGKR